MTDNILHDFVGEGSLPNSIQEIENELAAFKIMNLFSSHLKSAVDKTIEGCLRRIKPDYILETKEQSANMERRSGDKIKKIVYFSLDSLLRLCDGRWNVKRFAPWCIETAFAYAVMEQSNAEKALRLTYCNKVVISKSEMVKGYLNLVNEILSRTKKFNQKISQLSNELMTAYVSLNKELQYTKNSENIYSNNLQKDFFPFKFQIHINRLLLYKLPDKLQVWLSQQPLNGEIWFESYLFNPHSESLQRSSRRTLSNIAEDHQRSNIRLLHTPVIEEKIGHQFQYPYHNHQQQPIARTENLLSIVHESDYLERKIEISLVFYLKLQNSVTQYLDEIKFDVRSLINFDDTSSHKIQYNTSTNTLAADIAIIIESNVDWQRKQLLGLINQCSDAIFEYKKERTRLQTTMSPLMSNIELKSTTILSNAMHQMLMQFFNKDRSDDIQNSSMITFLISLVMVVAICQMILLPWNCFVDVSLAALLISFKYFSSYRLMKQVLKLSTFMIVIGLIMDALHIYTLQEFYSKETMSGFGGSIGVFMQQIFIFCCFLLHFAFFLITLFSGDVIRKYEELRVVKTDVVSAENFLRKNQLLQQPNSEYQKLLMSLSRR